MLLLIEDAALLVVPCSRGEAPPRESTDPAQLCSHLFVLLSDEDNWRCLTNGMTEKHQLVKPFLKTCSFLKLPERPGRWQCNVRA